MMTGSKILRRWRAAAGVHKVFHKLLPNFCGNLRSAFGAAKKIAGGAPVDHSNSYRGFQKFTPKLAEIDIKIKG
jgi:hypothetical protein